MSEALGLLIASIVAVLLGGILVWRLRAELESAELMTVLAMLGLSHVFGVLAWLVKGFSIVGMLVMLAGGYACLLVASWGRPGEFFRLMIDPEKRWSARNWLVQMRFVFVVLVAVFAGLPFLLRIL